MMTYDLCRLALFHLEHSIILKAYLEAVSATLIVLPTYSQYHQYCLYPNNNTLVPQTAVCAIN